MTARNRLPNRRPNQTIELDWQGQCIALSLLLQLGMTPEKISHSVGREHGKPASVVALLADTLAKEGEAYG